MGADVGPPDEMRPFLNQCLPSFVCRMGLAGKDELHGALRNGQQTKQSLWIVQQQVRPLVGREAARKSQCQGVGIKQVFRLVNRLGRRAGGGQLSGQAGASVFNERLAGGNAEVPETLVGDSANVLLQGLRRPQPAVLSTGRRPEVVGCRRVPGRHVDSVRDVADGHFVRRPVRKERPEEMAADLSVQATHTIHGAAPANGQVRHVETLRRVVRFLAAQGKQLVQRDAEFLLGIGTEIFLDEGRGETVKAGGHCRVGGEEVPRSSDGQRDFEGLRRLLHETVCSFQHGKGRMPFVQMTHLRLEAERAEQPPAADPEHHLLLQPQLRSAPVQLAGDPAMRREVPRVVAVEQVEVDPTDLGLPGAQPDRVAGQGDLQPQPLAVRVTQGRDRKLPGLVVRIEGLLRAVLVDLLTEVALLVE